MVPPHIGQSFISPSPGASCGVITIAIRNVRRLIEYASTETPISYAANPGGGDQLAALAGDLGSQVGQSRSRSGRGLRRRGRELSRQVATANPGRAIATMVCQATVVEIAAQLVGAVSADPRSGSEVEQLAITVVHPGLHSITGSIPDVGDLRRPTLS